jgi:hypothetical protein
MSQTQSTKQCSIDECLKPYYAKGFCHRHYKNHRYKTNSKYRAMVNASNKKYHAGISPERRKIWDTRYTAKNIDTIRAKGRIKQAERRVANKDAIYAATKAWKLNNREKLREYQKRWSEEHKTDRAIYQRARQAKIIGVRIDKTEIENWESRICGVCRLLIEGKFHIDHKTPLAKGGLHSVENLQLAHPLCNMSKKDKLIV